MKYYILPFISLLLLFVGSCSKIADLPSVDSTPDTDYSESEALADFAVILSRAVSESEDIRAFIQKKAVAQVDNDYDVFYPFVRDEKIKDQYSFRDHLVLYSDEESLVKIERALPLLTIYVPDLTWIEEEAFSADTWDVSVAEVLVCHVDEKGIKHFYYDGVEESSLQPGEGVPMCPSLIVKTNERIRCSQNTKAGEIQYEFISPAFDGRNTTKGRYDGVYSYTYITGVSTTDTSDYIDANALSQIAPIAIQAYNVFINTNLNAAQRDYCYYGMTPTNPIGHMNNNVRDRLFRFKLAPSSFRTLADAPKAVSHTDPDLMADIDDNGNSGFHFPDTYDEALDIMYKGGKLEIEIRMYYGGAGLPQCEKLVLSVDPRELFDIKKIKREEWSAWAWKFKFYRTWKYTISDSDILSKWYYPTESLRLPAWNLCNSASSVTFEFREIDSDADITTTTNVTHKYTVGVEDKITADGVKSIFGLEAKDENSETHSFAIAEKTGSEEMGQTTLCYVDPYIRTASPSAANPSRYLLYSYSTGTITFSFLPEIICY